MSFHIFSHCDTMTKERMQRYATIAHIASCCLLCTLLMMEVLKIAFMLKGVSEVISVINRLTYPDA